MLEEIASLFIFLSVFFILLGFAAAIESLVKRLRGYTNEAENKISTSRSSSRDWNYRDVRAIHFLCRRNINDANVQSK